MEKSNKRKITTIAILALAIIAVAGVGFSAWAIKGSGNKDVSGNVSVSVADVDQSINITDAKIGTDDSIKFDADGEGTLLTNSSGADDRTFSITYTIQAHTSALANFKGISAYVNGDGLKSAVASNYITLPEGVYASKDEAKAATSYLTAVNDFDGITADESGNKTLTVIDKSLEFGWGSAFDNANPTALTDASKLDDYVASLKAFQTLSLDFTLTLLAVVSA